jgi:predicted transcriptional regulator of viral defense system
MASKIIKEILNIGRNQNGYLKTQDLTKNNISKNYLAEMVNSGLIEKVSHGLYRLTDIDPEEHEFFIDAQKAIPTGIICFESALAYHKLSTINPQKIHLALPRKDKVRQPTYPPIKIHYLTDWYYEIGTQEVIIRNEPVKIYTPEKTICDCIKYQKKIGTDLLKEALSIYLKNKKTINLLYEMAWECKLEEPMRTYLEVLI